jgi:hypothetical protein
VAINIARSNLARLGLVLDGTQIKAASADVRRDLALVKQAGAATREELVRIGTAAPPPIRSVSDAILRMRQTLAQVRADAQASQLAIADPFQKGEIAVNRVTAAMQRMQVAARQAQASAMASQIGALDPFQAGGAGAGGGAARATASIASFNRVVGQAAVLTGGLSGRTLILANALGIATEKFAAIRAAQVAAAAATGSTVTVMGTLRATLASVNPLILAAVAGYAAYAITTKLLGDNTDKLVEAAEKNIAVQDKLATAMRSVNEAMRQSILATSNAKAELAAYLRGGESALQTAKNFAAALVVGAAAAKAGLDSERAAVAEFNRLQALTAAQQGLTAAQRAAAAAEAVQKNIAATAEALREEIIELTKGKAALEQYRLEKVKTGATPPIVTPEELQRLANLRRDIQRALQPIENLPIAAGGLVTTTIDELPPAIERVRAELDETFGQRLGRYAVNFSSLADELIGAFSGAADAIRGELQGVFGGGSFGTFLGNAASGGIAALFSGLASGVLSAFSASGPSFRREVDAWQETLDDWVDDIAANGDRLASELDSIAEQHEQLLDELNRIYAGRLAGFGAAGSFGGLAGSAGRNFLNDTLRAQSVEDYNKALDELNKTMQEAEAAAKARAAEEHRQLVTNLQIELARAKGNNTLAQQLERQERLNAAKTKEEQVLRKQIFAAEDAAIAHEKLTETMEANKRIVEDLESFQRSLRLGSLSPLSPGAQLAEARSQFEAIAALALGGDRSAAESLRETADAFLQASRGFNASGGGFVSDFQRVQDIIDAVQGRLGAEISDAEKQLRLSERHIDIAKEGVTIATEQRDAAVSAVKVQAEIGKEIVGLRQDMAVLFASLNTSIERTGDVVQTT